jgi:hypothetical protein
VWQEEKIKTAGLETSVPLEEEPAGCRRSDRKDKPAGISAIRYEEILECVSMGVND